MDIEYDEDFRKQLNEENKIGQGAFGIVYKIHKADKDYAIKAINLQKVDDEKVKDIEKEANILTKINHENIVKFYKSFKINKSYYIVMEYCKYSDLDNFIENIKNERKEKEKEILIDKTVIYSIILDICLGIKEIHKENIIHRDLKPENIFIDKDYKIKIGDFGIAKELGGTIHHTINMGTLNYMAPEIINLNTLGDNKKEKIEYDNKVDIWSLGCIIYELCTLEKCFNVFQIVQKKYDIPKMNNNKEFQEIIDKLLIVDPRERPNIDEVYNLIKNLNITSNSIDENYLNSLDDISRNIIKRNKNQIIIIIKVNQKDIKKKVFFLENDCYLKNNEVYKFDNYNEELKDLNSNNVELYINDQNMTTNFNKYFIPEKEGEYKIRIIFKNKMTDCRYMFRNCDNIKSVDLSSFDSSNVNNMNYMFGKCHFLEEVNLNNLNTDKVVDMSYMFNKCFYLKKLNFPSSFNIKNVEKMNFMFFECRNLSEIKFSSSFVTNKVTTMRGMFKQCFKLKSIDLTNFTAEKLLDMGYMFTECVNLEKISLNKKFKTNLVTNMIYLFNNCTNLKEINLAGVSQNSSNINLSSFNTENVKFLDYMFCDCKELKNLDLSSFNVKETINMTNMFNNCVNLEKLDISSIKNINNSTINNMFDNLKNIKEIKVNQNSIDFLKESFNNIKESFISL